MNNSRIQTPEIEINLRQAMWDLLAAWKAIITLAIIMAFAVAGAKYWKDCKTIAEKEAHVKNLIEQSELTDKERIEKMLDGLSSGDRNTVEYLIQQQTLINTQEQYLEESLLLNTDPTNQKYLTLKYYLESDGSSDLQAIADGYIAILRRHSSITELGKVLAPDAEIKYIYELINVYNSQVPDSDSKGLICTMEVVLPEEADGEIVGKEFNDILERTQEEINSKIGNHSIRLLSHDVSYKYNVSAVDRRVAINNSINSLLNNIKNISSSLSDEQKTVLEAATKIISGEDSQNNDIEVNSISKPSLSKKYLLAGFILGCMVYAGVYLLLVVLRGSVESNDMLVDYTGSRLLGSIYYPANNKGIKALTHSPFVNEIRYKNLGDIDKQIQKVISTIDSVCEHDKVSITRVFRINESKCEAEEKITERLVEALNDKGIKASLTTITNDTDEKVFLTDEDSICVICKGNKFSDVWNLTEMLERYGIKRLGNIYIGPQ